MFQFLTLDRDTPINSPRSQPATITNPCVIEARDAITAQRVFQPDVAIVLGSGLGPLAEFVEHKTQIAYTDIPHFPRTHAAGHAGKLLLGFLAGLRVVMMQGRVHRYEGWSTSECTFPLRVMHALGAQTLIATNAAGGLNPRFCPGDLMVVDSHINRLDGGWRTSSHATLDLGHPPVLRGEPIYDYGLIQRAKQLARIKDTVLHQGCYLATLGPTYETRSEYKMFRSLGADAVGMSTVPEVQLAHQLGMNVLAFSVITNVASMDFPQSTTHDEVVDVGNSAGPKLMAIVQQIMQDMSGQPD